MASAKKKSAITITTVQMGGDKTIPVGQQITADADFIDDLIKIGGAREMTEEDIANEPTGPVTIESTAPTTEEAP